MRTVEQFSRFNALLRKTYSKKVSRHPSSDDLESILAQYPKLVVAMNHGPMAGPLAGSIAMMDQYSKSGGLQRKPVIIAWRGLYKMPLFKYIVRYMSQVKTPPNLDGFVKKLTEEGFTDVFVMPEGENCSYGNGLDIEPFLSPRFVELALKAGTPILIAVHTGSEAWSNIIPVSEKLDPVLKVLPEKTYQRLKETRQVNFAPVVFRSLPEIQVSFKLYKPQITLADLDSPNARDLLQQESERVREIMQSCVDHMCKQQGELQLA